jgi:hypothetical protein
MWNVCGLRKEIYFSNIVDTKSNNIVDTNWVL